MTAEINPAAVERHLREYRDSPTWNDVITENLLTLAADCIQQMREREERRVQRYQEEVQ